jgi:ADP-heptose:LPS heptosyltransferase
MTSAVLINAIGDHYLALPAFRALQATDDACRIIGVKGIAHRVLAGEAFSDVQELEASWSSGRGWSFDVVALQDLLRGSDRVVSLCPWHTADLVATVSSCGARRTVGFGRGYDVPVFLDDGTHAFDQAFALVTALGECAQIDDFAYPVRLCATGQRVQRAVDHSRGAGERLLVVHTETKAAKAVANGDWARFLSRVYHQHPAVTICLIDKGAPTGELAQFVEGHSDRVYAARPSLAEATGLIAAANSFAGVDSCFLHVADLARTPVLAAFVSTSDVEFGVRFAAAVHVDCRHGNVPDALWEGWTRLTGA